MNKGLYGLPPGGGGGGGRVVELWSQLVATPLVQFAAAGALRGSYNVTSPAMTANVPQTLLSVQGAGVVDFVALLAANATGRTIALQFVVDGIILFNRSTATSAAAAGLLALGSPDVVNDCVQSYQPIPFSQGFQLIGTTSLSESASLFAYASWQKYSGGD